MGHVVFDEKAVQFGKATFTVCTYLSQHHLPDINVH